MREALTLPLSPSINTATAQPPPLNTVPELRSPRQSQQLAGRHDPSRRRARVAPAPAPQPRRSRQHERAQGLGRPERPARAQCDDHSASNELAPALDPPRAGVARSCAQGPWPFRDAVWLCAVAADHSALPAPARRRLPRREDVTDSTADVSGPTLVLAAGSCRIATSDDEGIGQRRRSRDARHPPHIARARESRRRHTGATIIPRALSISKGGARSQRALNRPASSKSHGEGAQLGTGGG